MPSTSKQILYIDDDADDREFLRVMLRRKNEEVEMIEAENGFAGLNYLNTAKSTGALPCLIVLDLNMPVLNGRETFHRLHQDEVLNKVPVLIFTTSESPADKLFFETNGAELLSKPTDILFYQQAAEKMLQYCI